MMRCSTIRVHMRKVHGWHDERAIQPAPRLI